MPPERQKESAESSNAPLAPSDFQKQFLEPTLRALALIFLAALSSPISQLTLAPAFGAGPSSINHGTMITITFVVGFVFPAVGPSVGFDDVGDVRLLSVWVAWIPVVQCLLLPFNGRLGPVMGPVLNGMLSCHTILLSTAAAMAHILPGASTRAQNKLAAPQNSIPTGMYTLMFRVFEKALTPYVTGLLTKIRFLTPVHLQLGLASAFACVFPSWLVVLAIPALLHAQYMNPHFSSTAVESSLQPHNWTLLERQWSNTGYISVLDSFDMKYRVMRCDHSLLGGEWLLTEDREKKEGWKVTEPIYAVFQMLEAVRLIQVEPVMPDVEAKALVIGLGIGTAPKALIAHGIRTTVVELDPVVHDFATKYFGLPANHTAVIQDAVSWVEEETSTDKTRYDYIIHDVFTGGTEPLSLFNAEFLGNLRTLLTPNGVIAINYAGDLLQPLTATVLTTINTVFSSQCKIYRDAPVEKDQLDNDSSDFLNMVVFCRNSPGEITFRTPRQADYLGSKSRMYYMLPKPEHEIAFPHASNAVQRGEQTFEHSSGKPTGSRSDASCNAQKPQPDQRHGPGQLLNLGDEPKFAVEQGRSAVRHWRIMRKVLPDAVWDLW